MPEPTPAEIAPPAPDEYTPFYAGYVARALQLPAPRLGHTAAALAAWAARVSDPAFRYAPGKWSIGEVVGHMAETERVFAYRLLRFARGDAQPLPGFDENAFVAAAGFDAVPLEDLVAWFAAERAATQALVATVPAEAWTRRGEASGRGMTARAALYVLAGHAAHHLDVLAARYGAARDGAARDGAQ
ncbi:MAG: DinB family protein [Rubricoccaceae bacterium]